MSNYYTLVQYNVFGCYLHRCVSGVSALVQFSCYQHRYECLGLIYVRLSLESSCATFLDFKHSTMCRKCLFSYTILKWRLVYDVFGLVCSGYITTQPDAVWTSILLLAKYGYLNCGRSGAFVVVIITNEVEDCLCDEFVVASKCEEGVVGELEQQGVFVQPLTNLSGSSCMFNSWDKFFL